MTEQDQRWVPYAQVIGQDMGGGLERKILAFGQELMCVENAFQAGAVGALHSHPHTQVTYVVSGEFAFHIGDETQHVTAGDTMYVPGGTVHGCHCLATGAILDIYTPMRADFLPGQSS